MALLAGLLPAALVATHAPLNHIDGDVRPIAWIPLAGTTWLLAAFALRLGSRRWTVVAGVVCVAVLVECVAIDHLNLIDDYDLWTARGMPDALQFTGW